MNKAIRALPFFLIAAVICVLDQLLKCHVKAFLDTKPDRQIPFIHGFCDIVYRNNTGGAFSLFDGTPIFFLIFPSILVLAMIVLLVKFAGDGETLSIIPVSIALMLGGAAGNMIDRVRFGKVFDFIDCYVGKYHWPSFNLADASIVCGVILFAFFWLIIEQKSANQPGADSSASDKDHSAL